eukprot:11568284-Alexandrium_andersonii.AAC.1
MRGLALAYHQQATARARPRARRPPCGAIWPRLPSGRACANGRAARRAARGRARAARSSWRRRG